jgi:hypothetical protein
LLAVLAASFDFCLLHVQSSPNSLAISECWQS